jgi:hypothetical protein
MTARKRGARYSPGAWAEKEALAEKLLAEAGVTIATVRDAIRGMPGTGTTEEDLHRSAVLAGITAGGPPASDEDMRPVAAILGLHLITDLAPAADRKAS